MSKIEDISANAVMLFFGVEILRKKKMVYRIKNKKKQRKVHCSDCGEQIEKGKETYVGTERLCQRCFYYHSREMNRGSK